jgi:cobalt-precorrin 5A hydrolase/precorrin-3B C17-methyltransferase
MDAVREEWTRSDGLVMIGATGIAVRAIAPLLAAKDDDPAVVSVDDAGRHVIALTGGHRAGANDLAHEVASLLGAESVISTATDLFGIPALDDLPGFRAEGDVAGVTRLWLDGHAPSVEVADGLEAWPLPPGLAGLVGVPGSGGRITISDHAREAGAGEVLLRPPSLAVGVGASRGADPGAATRLLADTLARFSLHPACVSEVASIDLKADEEAVAAAARACDCELVTYPATALASRQVPNPSSAVAGAVGTPSVAEAAALVAAGPDSVLVAEKSISTSRDSTVAIARRAFPLGHLYVVGIGPGEPRQRTPQATAAVRHADVVIGYGPYVDMVGDLLSPRQDVIRSPIGAETARTREALDRVARGHTVALVCSGDPGVYAMGSLACELAPAAGDPPITVVPGVTASLAGGAVLGAPLGHDHASVSLSDLLTPWEMITRRLRAVAEGDFVVSLYNPRSERRTTQLKDALAILGEHRAPSTPAAVITNIGRPGQTVVRSTLGQLDSSTVGMLSLVIVGSSQTRWVGSRMVTPRGYPG